MEDEIPPKKSSCLRWFIIGAIGVVVVLAILIIGGFLFYTIRYGAESDQSISEPLSLPTSIPTPGIGSSQVPEKPSNLPQAPIFVLPTPIAGCETCLRR